MARIATSSTYNAGLNAVGLSAPSWNNVSEVGTERTLTVSTTGKTTNISKSKKVVLSLGSWDSGNLPVSILEDSSSGTPIAKSSVSVPAASKTTWTNTAGRTWRADLTIGGVTRSSTTKDFQSYYDDGYTGGYDAGYTGGYDAGYTEGYKVTGIGVNNVAGAATAAGTSFINGYTSVGTLVAGLRNSSFYIRFQVYTHGATYKKYIKVN